MIIYVTDIRFEPPTTMEALLEPLAEWMSRKLRRHTIAADLGSSTTWQTRGQDVEIVVDRDNDTIYTWAMRYSHPDREVNGRSWVTELGIAMEQDRPRVTVLLQTRDMSARVVDLPSPTRPGFVPMMLECAVPERTTPGLAPLVIEEANLGAFRQLLERRDRTAPVILLSANADGVLPIEPESLCYQVGTLAHVAQFSPDLGHLVRQRVLGDHTNAWGGVIKVFWPYHRNDPDWIPPRYRMIRPEEFDTWSAEGKRLENEILALITHRTNIRHVQQHISPEKVRELALRRSIQTRRDENTIDPELFTLLEQLEQEARQEVIRLEEANSDLHDQKGDLDDELRKVRAEMESLRYQLNQLSRSRGSSDGDSLSVVRAALLPLVKQQMQLLDALQVVASTFPDRVVVLDSAYKSAVDARLFEQPEEALRLLWLLATDYWDMLVSGRGDLEAKSVFGNSFAPTESETVRNNDRARRLRTFVYEGEAIEMPAHLKIGVKPSIAKTWRAHFYWDAAHQRIVIGHCGKHLDHE
jgi:hypothetical protein